MVRRVLVTGVSRYLGSRVAHTLSLHPDVTQVIGVDVVPPRTGIGRAEYVRVDIRHPMISRVIADSRVDTVVHVNVIATPTAAGGRASMKEINVIGSMQLLAACQKSRTVQQLVVKSTAGVYGSSPRDPAVYTEEIAPKVPPSGGWGKDTTEVEGYVRSFSRRRPDVDVVTLRMANIVGPGMRTQLTDYLELRVMPVVAGFDPRLQLLHEDDAVGSLVAATLGDAVGTINVAGDGYLTLMQMVAMSRRLPLPVPRMLTDAASRLVRLASGVTIGPDEFRFFTNGRGLDTTRMREDLHFEPKYTTREAFLDYLQSRRAA